jgi:hypothetical protein
MARSYKITDKFPNQKTKKSWLNDCTFLLTGAPRWYCNVHEKSDRNHNRMELHRMMQNFKEDDNYRYWHKHQANYNWW